MKFVGRKKFSKLKLKYILVIKILSFSYIRKKEEFFLFMREHISGSFECKYN